MKQLHKSLIAGGIAGTLGISTIASAALVSAQSGDTTNDPTSSLIQKIAAKFQLKEDDVRRVFEEDREARRAEHQQRISTRLQALVDDDTLTSEQKTAIEQKLVALHKERQADKETFKEFSPEERRIKMEEKRSELETWAKEQGIELSNLRGIFMGSHYRGMPGPDAPAPAMTNE